MNKCDVLEQILRALIAWNFSVFGIQDIYRIIEVIEDELTAEEVCLLNELMTELVNSGAVDLDVIHPVKGQMFVIKSRDKLRERLAICRL